MPDELNFNVPIRLNSFGETIRRIEAERMAEAEKAVVDGWTEQDHPAKCCPTEKTTQTKRQPRRPSRTKHKQHHHQRRDRSTMNKEYQLLFVAHGDDPSDPKSWKPLNVSSIEFQIDENDPAEIATTPILKHHYEQTFTVHKISRQAMKLITGRLTFPGDAPLIHNGKAKR